MATILAASCHKIHVANVCDELKLQPSVFYRRLQQVHENAAVARCDGSGASRRFSTPSQTGLFAFGVTTVAMELTGIYRIQMFEILDACGLA